jgi:ABC-2 type transport system ATP-binding protein
MSSKSTVLEIKNLTRSYGKIRGIENISLNLNKAEIFGFLGPNGAGKTTTINMLLNFMKPSSGSIEIFGLNNQEHGIEIRARIGYLAGDMALEGGLTGWQQLEYLGNIRGNYNYEYISELANRLSCDLSRKIKTLSRGNRQKVGLISALMHRPELLILDEPTSGLDPIMQSEFNKIILEHKKAGGTAFISSHVLSEVQELCDRVAFIREGKLIANKPLKDIIKGAPKHIKIISSDSSELKKIDNLKLIKNTQIKGSVLNGVYSDNINYLLSAISKFKIDDISIFDADLESIFMEYYEEASV